MTGSAVAPPLHRGDARSRALLVATTNAGKLREITDILEGLPISMLTLRDRPGIRGYIGPIRAVLSSPLFLTGALCMALNFFAMLYTLSIVDLSLAAPATASLTFIGNAAAAKVFLRENVDRRRWLAALFVCIGVALLAH